MHYPSRCEKANNSNSTGETHTHAVTQSLKNKIDAVKSLENLDMSSDYVENSIQKTKTVLRQNTRLKMWHDLLHNGATSLLTSKDEVLSKVALISEDDLYQRLRQTNISPEAIDALFLQSYARFRVNFLAHKDFLNNYAVLSDLFRPPYELLNDAKINLINLVKLLKSLSKLYASIQNELKSYPPDTSFVMLPFHIEHADFVALVAPAQVHMLKFLFDGQHRGLLDPLFDFDRAYLNTNDQALVFSQKFIGEESLKKILKFIVEVSTQNLKKLDELSASNSLCKHMSVFNTPHFQMYLSIVGMCLSSVLLLDFDDEHYLKHEIDLKLQVSKEARGKYMDKEQVLEEIESLKKDLVKLDEELVEKKCLADKCYTKEDHALKKKVSELENKRQKLQRNLGDSTRRLKSLECELLEIDTKQQIKLKHRRNELKNSLYRQKNALKSWLKEFSPKLGAAFEFDAEFLGCVYTYTSNEIDRGLQTYADFLNNFFKR